MKKLLAILALAGIFGTAQADSLSVEVGNVDVNNGQAKQDGVGLRATHNLSNKFAVDLGLQSLKNTVNSQSTTRVEIGGTFTQPVAGGFAGYVRAGLGNQFGSYAGNVGQEFSYYSVEPGVAYQVGNFDARLGYRYRTSFETLTRGFQTNTVKGGVGYALSKHDRLGFNIEDVKGDYTARQYTVNYTRSF
jgi:hypothetical protein